MTSFDLHDQIVSMSHKITEKDVTMSMSRNSFFNEQESRDKELKKDQVNVIPNLNKDDGMNYKSRDKLDGQSKSNTNTNTQTQSKKPTSLANLNNMNNLSKQNSSIQIKKNSSVIQMNQDMKDNIVEIDQIENNVNC